ncbi:MAG: DNA alkylation repair protein [Planctomycetota bacterium]|jgi:3-methyladenine DNA glycosylase AlkD
MTRNEVLKELKAMGTAQNRKVYPRHGVKGPAFGVSYANLGKLKKRIKSDQPLAEQLWASGNHDARILATMIADPEAMSAKTLDAWARDLDNYVLTDAFSTMLARTRFAPARADKWASARSEWKAAAAWNICASLDRPDAYFEERLAAIEAGIHDARNRVKHSMNQALIGIGVRNANLQGKATAAARRIGKVDVDHGETGCKTPDAAAYIRKTVEHRKKRKK